MAREEYENIIVGLDIGTTKICSIIGEVDDENHVNIIGIGTSPSHGLRKGVVVNIENTVESIKKAVADASRMAGVEIGSVYAGIAGGHIKGLNSRAMIAITKGEKEITKEDVERVIDAAKAVAIPLDREVIHILPQEFIVDNQDGIKDPVGMTAVRLEAEVHIVTAAVTSAQNIVRSVEKAELFVEDIVLQPLASSEAVLSQDERDLGVVMVDIGGGTTDIAIFVDGGIWHTGVISIGGNQVTGDIAIGLRTPTTEAEELKKKYGCALASLINESEEVKVPGVGGRADRSVPRRAIAEIIQPRMEEIFELVVQEVRLNGFEDRVASGIVVTGGASLLEGIVELSEKVTGMPTRVGTPIGIGGLVDVVNNPIYATGVGLILYGVKNRTSGKGLRFTGGGPFERILGRMKQWFSEFF
ncbi:MAG: cell division protein FtsA [Candidatus Firestonebacteria bacterium]